jgi:CRP-like cAMP-binding protein
MASDAVFSGKLTYFSVGDLIQLIGANGSTGVLQITSPYAAHKGEIYFSNGNPVDAACGSETGLGAIYTLFGYVQGEFGFSLKTAYPHVAIHESRMQIMLNGYKKLDDGEIKKVGPITFEKLADESMVQGIPLPLIKGPMVDYTYVLDEERFESGSEIVMQGRHGSWLWVILDGIVQIIKETPLGTVKIVRIGQGAFVGSVASFLMGDYVRSATAIAENNVLLGVLDSHRLLTEFNRLSPEFKNCFLSLDKRLKQVTDRAVDYYCGKDSTSDVGEKVPFTVNERDQDKLCLIKEGRAYVVRKTPAGEVLLASLFAGDFIGPLSFIDLDHEFYSASVYGSKNLRVEEINREALISEYGRLPSTLKNIISTIGSSVSATSMMASEYQKMFVAKRA